MIDKSGAPAAPMMMPIPHNLGRCDRKAEKRAQRIDDHSG
jgi:hypothetical protein